MMKHILVSGIALSLISCGRIDNIRQLQRMYGKEIDLSVLSARNSTDAENRGIPR